VNSTNPKLNWVHLTSVLGILFAVIALCGFAIMLMNWGDLRIRPPYDWVGVVGQFTAVAWLGELICGIIVLKYRKIIGRILIALGIILFIFFSLIPASG
jgi:hypothetical protein